MASPYDDEIWTLVTDPGPVPAHLQRFVAGLEPVERALDLGCGDGRPSQHLAAEQLTLADVSAVALTRAHERLPRAQTAELDPDAPLPLADNAFDLLLCAETIEHVRDTQLLLSEARRVLRPGGRLALTTPAHGRATALRMLVSGLEVELDPRSPHLRLFTRRSLAALLDDSGFDVASLRREAGTLLAVATR